MTIPTYFIKRIDPQEAINYRKLMRQILLYVLLLSGIQALAQQKVSYAIQLGKISHDQLIVEVKPPSLKAGAVEYCFRKLFREPMQIMILVVIYPNLKPLMLPEKN
jgi:hypothetical protein